ncbi:MAG: hypothetical protein D6820_08630 [Lentisphaerae bacterium]|nr:MAG: hypothetical protein D6820_08630 [Lentisphaerota bacterium]
MNRSQLRLFVVSGIFCGLMMLGNGCVFTKLISMPMRVVGGVVSIVPVAGNHAHDVIDTAADQIDKLPF